MTTKLISFSDLKLKKLSRGGAICVIDGIDDVVVSKTTFNMLMNSASRSAEGAVVKGTAPFANGRTYSKLLILRW
jgi:hypothetical protein